MSTRENLLHAFEASIASDPLYSRFRAMPVCQELESRETMLLFSCFDVRTYPADAVIYEANTTSENTVHLILNGTVSVSSPTNDIYTHLKAGDVFGLFSFLDEQRLHSASVRTKDDVTLLTINRAYFNVITLEDPTLGNQMLRFMFRLLSRMSLKLESEYAAMHQFALATRK